MSYMSYEFTYAAPTATRACPSCVFDASGGYVCAKGMEGATCYAAYAEPTTLPPLQTPPLQAPAQQRAAPQIGQAAPRDAR
jgi:hypothetical protein